MARSSSYFVPLLSMPDIITEVGEYRTRRGEIVKVTAVSKRHDFGCTGEYPNGISEGWHKSGRIYEFSITKNDIVEN